MPPTCSRPWSSPGLASAPSSRPRSAPPPRGWSSATPAWPRALANTMQQVGGSIGTALLTAIAAQATARSLGGRPATSADASTVALAVTHGYSVGFQVAAGIFLGAAVICALLLRPRADQPRQLRTGHGSCRLTAATTAAVGYSIVMTGMRGVVDGGVLVGRDPELSLIATTLADRERGAAIVDPRTGRHRQDGAGRGGGPAGQPGPADPADVRQRAGDGPAHGRALSAAAAAAAAGPPDPRASAGRLCGSPSASPQDRRRSRSRWPWRPWTCSRTRPPSSRCWWWPRTCSGWIRPRSACSASSPAALSTTRSCCWPRPVTTNPTRSKASRARRSTLRRSTPRTQSGCLPPSPPTSARRPWPRSSGPPRATRSPCSSCRKPSA